MSSGDEHRNGGADWSPSSWRSKPIAQLVDFKNEDGSTTELDKAREKLKRLPPLVSFEEVDSLHAQLKDVYEGKRFLLQGGDCAERFLDCESDSIEKKLKIMLQMSLVLIYGSGVPVVRVARMAGQFAKPRSKPTEMIDGTEYCSFRGDNVNSHDLSARKPDPKRLVEGYFHSAATLNYARALINANFADLRSAHHWDLGFVKDSENRAMYKRMVDRIQESLKFVEVCGVSQFEDLRRVDLFTCHEGLNLDYEEALTRLSPSGNGYYNLGAPFLWIGDRTRQLDHAHVEYFRGIQNPIGCKVGPTMKPAELVGLILTLCPDIKSRPGHVTLISRFGASKVESMLPPLITAVKNAGLPVIWVCDPMHGNTTTKESNGKKYKTRSFDDILKEVSLTFDIHRRLGSRLGGVHFEMCGEQVTECIGGPEELTCDDLPHRYTTYCDPRLNYAQSLEMALLIAQALKTGSPLEKKSHVSFAAGATASSKKRKLAKGPWTSQGV